MTKIPARKSVVGIAAGASLLAIAAAPLFAVAASTSTASVGVGINAGVITNLKAAKLPQLISKGDAAIEARITALNSLSTKVQALKNVSGAEKTTIATQVQTNISGLTELKVKLDADTDISTARGDYTTIFGKYRIYALVIPQGTILSAADRVDTIAGLMNTLSAKLQLRIMEAQSAGQNVTTLQAALTSFNAEVSDSTAKAGAATTGIASLMPDGGDKAKASANHDALVAARADIKTSTTDLKSARQNAETIAKALKGMHVTASTTATVTASSSAN